ncbi:MAG: glycosyl transferase family 2 [uncultured bacterium]|nr:MAG: glycosyl transferase family 2 [uncultured bacterium]
MLPLVSIITPSYNRAGFIELCLDSVCAQTYKNIEHIVIDGGSSDATVEILRHYEKISNLRWISEKDEGMYHAINKGIALAKGDVIAYLNTDDAYFPWSVETALDRLLSGASIVYGDLCLVKKSGAEEICYLQFYRRFVRRFYTHFGTIAQPTVFLKREIFKQLGKFDTTYQLIADCEYWLRCASKGYEPQKIDEILAVQIDHQETLREVHEKLLRQEFSRLRNQYRVARYTDIRLLGRIENAFLSRLYKALFFLTFFGHGRMNRWPQFIGVFKKTKATFSAREIITSLLPGFLIQQKKVKSFSSSLTPARIEAMVRAKD